MEENKLMKTKNIILDEVKEIAFRLAKETMGWDEPIPEFESRFPDKLESCLLSPFQTWDGKLLHKGLTEKASILFYLMIKNHPFQNGNKRIALVTLLYFLYKNGKWINVDNQELYNFAKWIAASNPILKDDTVSAINSFIKLKMIDSKALLDNR